MFTYDMDRDFKEFEILWKKSNCQIVKDKQKQSIKYILYTGINYFLWSVN